MKALPCFLTALFCLVSCLAQAQFSKSSQTRVSGVNPPMSVKIWSDWFKNSGYPNLEASYAKLTDNQITLRIRNNGSGKLEADFTANECPDSQKEISGWQHKIIEPGATITLTFPTGGCNAGFHWWSKNLHLLTPDGKTGTYIFGQ